MENNHRVLAERKEYVCPECHRSFVSGKALGGHISAHVQAKKSKTKIRSSLEEEDHQEDVDDEMNVCFYCDKQFPSRKSLYGHMRSHRNRPRRVAAEEESAGGERVVVDLRRRLEHWGATDKRGRSLAEKEAGSGLVYVQYGNGISETGLESSEDTDEYYCKDHLEEIKMQEGEEVGVVSSYDNNKRKRAILEEEHNQEDDHHHHHHHLANPSNEINEFLGIDLNVMPH